MKGGSEFKNDYVVVNPTTLDIQSFQLPNKACVQLTHENLSTNTKKLPVIQEVAIPAHHGMICLKPSARGKKSRWQALKMKARLPASQGLPAFYTVVSRHFF